MNTNNKSCPVSGWFCWKNPLQVVGLIALLPFGVKGGLWLLHSVCAFCDNCCK
jgi:hypothetical protein